MNTVIEMLKNQVGYFELTIARDREEIALEEEDLKTRRARVRDLETTIADINRAIDSLTELQSIPEEAEA